MMNFSRNEHGLESLSTPLSQIRSQWALPSETSLSPWPHPLLCLDYCTSPGPGPRSQPQHGCPQHSCHRGPFLLVPLLLVLIASYLMQ